MAVEKICLICGQSGTGKTTTLDACCEKYGYKPLRSYTTRPKRNADDTDHIYVEDSDYALVNPDDIVAFMVDENTGYKYWATRQQVDESDFYVIDFMHIVDFLRAYNGSKRVTVAEFVANPFLSMINIMRRKSPDGKTMVFSDDIKTRLETDKQFNGSVFINKLHTMPLRNTDVPFYRLIPISNIEELHKYTNKVLIGKFIEDDPSLIFDPDWIECDMERCVKTLDNIYRKGADIELMESKNSDNPLNGCIYIHSNHILSIC